MTNPSIPGVEDSFMAMPSARATAASRWSLLRVSSIAGIAIALAACEQPSDKLAWYDQPNDPEVYALVLDRCLSASRGPQRTHYNDWDEAISACGQQAGNVSRYCPAGAQCAGGAVSLEAVRAVLASGMSASGQDPQGLEAKPASPTAESGDAQ